MDASADNDTPMEMVPTRIWASMHVLTAAICEEPGDLPPEIRERARDILDHLLDDHLPDPLDPGWIWTDLLRRAERFSSREDANKAHESMPNVTIAPPTAHIDETPSGEWMVWTYINGKRTWIAPDLDRKLDLLRAVMEKASADLEQAHHLLDASENRFRHAFAAAADQAAFNAKLTADEQNVSTENDSDNALPTP